MSQQTTAPVATARFCRHCGNQLQAGAHFCRHCGAAIGVPGPGAAQPVLGAATGPAWPSGWASGRDGRSRSHRLPAMAKLAAVFLPLLLVGVFVVAVLPGAPSCVYSCGTPTGPVLPAGQAYHSQLGYSFEYPSRMSLDKAELGDEVTLADPAGQMLIWAGRGGQSSSSLVQTYSQKLMGSSLQNLRSFGAVPGAEIGFVPGDGEFYNGLFQQQNGQVLPIGVAVLAARTGAIWAVAAVWAVCISPQDSQPQECNSQFFRGGGIFANGDDFDDVLARWQWPAG